MVLPVIPVSTLETEEELLQVGGQPRIRHDFMNGLEYKQGPVNKKGERNNL